MRRRTESRPATEPSPPLSVQPLSRLATRPKTGRRATTGSRIGVGAYDALVAESFAEMLQGGHPNSLGRTEEVVGVVLADRARLEELFATIADPDEVVRLRVGDALEKVCRGRGGLPSRFSGT